MSAAVQSPSVVSVAGVCRVPGAAESLSALLAALIKSVVATCKAGAITLKIDVKPSTAGALAVKATVSTKIPKGLPPESLLWPTPDGNLLAEDPRQTKLDLKPVAAEPVRELKTVSA